MRILFTVVLLAGSFVFVSGAEIKGKIYFDRDTATVTFKVPLSLFGREPVLHNLRSKIVYFNAKGQRKVLRAKDAREINFTYENETIRMVSKPHPNSLNKKRPRYYFLKLEEEGSPLNLYIFYDETTSDDGMNSVHTDYVERYFIEKNKKELIPVSGLSFRKKILEIVGDCPEVARKIESREWRKRDLKEIVAFYNRSCKSG